jgi:hypothetical protein
MYRVPPVRPVTVARSDVVVATVVQAEPVHCWSAYRSIDTPPVLDGAVHDTVTEPVPAVAAGEPGADGGVPGTAITVLLAELHPALLWANTRK